MSSPSTTCRSVRQTPQASTRSSTWPGPGSGSGSSASSSGCPAAREHHRPHRRSTLPRHARSPRLPLRVPDPGAHDVPHQPLARRDAAEGGGASRRVRAHVARARDPLLGRGLVDDADDGRRPGRADRRRPAGLDRDAPERRGRRGGRALVLLPDRPGAEPRRLRARATSRPCATCTRRSPISRSSSARTTRRSSSAIDERTLLVPISHVLFKTAEIQDVEPIVRRAHEVGAHVILDCYQSAGIVPFDVTALGRRLRRRRLRQVALRRARERLALRAARSRRAARADLHGLAGARAAVRLRGGDGATRPARRGSSPARRTCRRTTPRRPATT